MVQDQLAVRPSWAEMKKVINAGVKSKVSTVSIEAKTVSIAPIVPDVEIVENVEPVSVSVSRNGRNGQYETAQNGSTATAVSTVSIFRQGLTEVLSKMLEQPEPDKQTIKRLTQLLIDAKEVKSKTDIVQKVWMMKAEKLEALAAALRKRAEDLSPKLSLEYVDIQVDSDGDLKLDDAGDISFYIKKDEIPKLIDWLQKVSETGSDG